MTGQWPVGRSSVSQVSFAAEGPARRAALCSPCTLYTTSIALGNGRHAVAEIFLSSGFGTKFQREVPFCGDTLISFRRSQCKRLCQNQLNP